MLIDKGADANDPFGHDEYEYTTVLVSAIHRRDHTMIKILLEAGARVDVMYSYSGTTLQAAVKAPGIDLAQILIDAGADVNTPSGQVYEKACQVAAANKEFNLLTTPIQRASLANNTELVQVLICEGADVNACPWERNVNEMSFQESYRYEDPLTALQAAVANKNAVLVRNLLGADADVDARGCGTTPLQIAAAKGDTQIVRILLKRGAHINASPKSRYGRTALQAAASTGDCELVQQLLDADADINPAASPAGGRTALQAAAQEGSVDLVEILIEAGDDVNAEASPEHGRTCLQAAAEGMSCQSSFNAAE